MVALNDIATLLLVMILCSALSAQAQYFMTPIPGQQGGGYDPKQKAQPQQPQPDPAVASAGVIKGGNGLHVNLYKNACPKAEEIIANVIYDAVQKDKTIAPALVRLHFHDCFVRGCDASILLNVSPEGHQPEKSSPGNTNTIRGYEIIDQAKAELEKACPGTVSCADTIAFAARDALVKIGFPTYLVPAGRRDGFRTNATDTFDLPGSGNSVNQLTTIFAEKGLTQDDLVTLLGAHTFGTAHCSSFQDVLLYLNNVEYEQESLQYMDAYYADYLKKKCPRPTVVQTTINGAELPLDAITPDIFDNGYYKALLAKKGLLRSDQALMNNPDTKKLVETYAQNQGTFFKKFAKAMVKMGRIGVLTKYQGEVRRDCRFVNNPQPQPVVNPQPAKV